MKRHLLPLALLIGTFTSTFVSASPVSFSFIDGNRSATALFENSGGNLQVTLTNTSLADARVPTDLLTALFFNIAGSPSLTRVSANICVTCSILNPGGTPTDPSPLGVGGEWAFLGGATSLTPFAGYNNPRFGLSSTGLDIFGPGNRFPGDNLAGPDSPDGPQYGITTAADNPATDNGGLDVPIIKNQVLFTLSGFGSIDPLAAISNLTFLYGTALDEPRFHPTCQDCTINTTSTAVPEPVSLVLVGSSILGLVARRRQTQRRRQRSNA